MTKPRTLTLTLALLPFLLLAGCSASQGPGGQEAQAPGSLAYQGASTGQHQSTFQCDGTGTVSVGGQLGSGSVTIRVLDGDGGTVYTKEFSGAGQAADSRSVDGEPGMWTISASRREAGGFGGGWSGQYGVNVEC